MCHHIFIWNNQPRSAQKYWSFTTAIITQQAQLYYCLHVYINCLFHRCSLGFPFLLIKYYLYNIYFIFYKSVNNIYKKYHRQKLPLMNASSYKPSSCCSTSHRHVIFLFNTFLAFMALKSQSSFPTLPHCIPIFLFQFLVNFTFKFLQKLLQELFYIIPVLHLCSLSQAVYKMKCWWSPIMKADLKLNFWFPFWWYLLCWNKWLLSTNKSME